MWQAIRAHTPIYLIEAWALGMFMVSAAFFTILLESPSLPVRQLIADPFVRRAIMGAAMGLTAVLLIYSPWGKRSGAHMNPAVTLTFLQLDRIRPADAAGYMFAQFAGGALGIFLFKWMVYPYISDPAVNYVVTVPGPSGWLTALVLEALMSFCLFLVVLLSSNAQKLAPYTGYFVGVLLTFFIAFEAPFSGMSINPARTVASALPSGIWRDWWIYFAGPIVGMNAAGFVFRRIYRWRNNGNCLSMDCHMSGKKHQNPIYEVLGPKR